MKKLLLLLLLSGFINSGFSQKIPPHFFGQNAWMSDTLGNIDECDGELVGMKCKLYGKIHQNNTWEKVRQSGVQLIRFGGEHADENMPTRRQYIQMIDSARAKGMEPLLQVPYNNNKYTCDTAASLARYINVTMKRNVKYWSIGNEPDLPPPNGYGYFTASPVADYTKQFAIKMKAVDSTIITLGPELTYYDDRNNLISDLTKAGGPYDITGRVPGHTYYYIDIITFHSYPFGGDQKREQLISNLKDPWHISHMLGLLKGKVDSCNAFHKRSDKPLRIALTETNMNYRNSADPELGAQSFIAGQFWCELMGVAMEKDLEFVAFWSVIENSLGYIDEKTNKFWPTYHHFQMTAKNFKGEYCRSTADPKFPMLKQLASADDSTISVLIMNQAEKKGYQKFSLAVGPGQMLSAGAAVLTIPSVKEMSGTILYNDSIRYESTWLLKFSKNGELLSKTVYEKGDAAPKKVKIRQEHLFVKLPQQIKSGAQVKAEAAGNKKAGFAWYAGSSVSALPVNESQLSLPPDTAPAERYRLVISYEGCRFEKCVDLVQ
jgi:hypothetical protein